MREGFKIEDIHLENEICSNLEYFQVVVLVLGTCDGVAGNEPEIRLTETAKKMQRALRKFTEILDHVPLSPHSLLCPAPAECCHQRHRAS